MECKYLIALITIICFSIISSFLIYILKLPSTSYLSESKISKIAAIYENPNFQGQVIELNEGTYTIADIRRMNYTSDVICKSFIVKDNYKLKINYYPNKVNLDNKGSHQMVVTGTIYKFVFDDNSTSNIDNIETIQVLKI